MTMGNGFNFHTPHWHGNLVNVRGQYMDVVPTIGPAQFVTADMVPDMAGTWMFHCHVDEHMKGGMQTMYQVLDTAAANSEKGSSSSAGGAPHLGASAPAPRFPRTRRAEGPSVGAKELR